MRVWASERAGREGLGREERKRGPERAGAAAAGPGGTAPREPQTVEMGSELRRGTADTLPGHIAELLC